LLFSEAATTPILCIKYKSFWNTALSYAGIISFESFKTVPWTLQGVSCNGALQAARILATEVDNLRAVYSKQFPTLV
jgi:hypothetical protein